MMAFDVRSEDKDFTVVIFATGNHHAAQLFCDHHERVHGIAPGCFSLTRRTISRERNKRWLRDALERGRAGLGLLGDHGWTIAPIIPVTDRV